MGAPRFVGPKEDHFLLGWYLDLYRSGLVNIAMLLDVVEMDWAIAMLQSLQMNVGYPGVAPIFEIWTI